MQFQLINVHIILSQNNGVDKIYCVHPCPKVGVDMSRAETRSLPLTYSQPMRYDKSNFRKVTVTGTVEAGAFFASYESSAWQADSSGLTVKSGEKVCHFCKSWIMKKWRANNNHLSLIKFSTESL